MPRVAQPKADNPCHATNLGPLSSVSSNHMTWIEHRKTRTRYEHQGHARFLTFSTLDRQPFFNDQKFCNEFADQLMRTRERYGFKLHAWVIMPEHVHLLIFPIGEVEVSKILIGLKRPVATRVLRHWREQGADVPSSFWQPGGGHDRNIFSGEEFAEKIEYIHQNPVKRGFVECSADWRWSSYRAWKNLETLWPMIDRG